MEKTFSSSDFPPISSKPVLTTSEAALSWSNIVAAPRPGKNFNLSSSSPPEDPLDFSDVHVKAALEEWNLALVGYSIGRRPYYESLLSAMRRAWQLKGTLKLLSLSDGFFMLKFTSSEDYEMALAAGVWFFLGKPFVLQKWIPNFKPVREEYSSIPIWFKILDLPLPCWTPEGISRIASKIGIPLAVDDLTAEKSRLTYARVCVQASKNCKYPESIPITILGEPFDLKIQYEWKPKPCEHCGSIVHTPDFCPTKPNLEPDIFQQQKRGRSTSRKPPKPVNRVNGVQKPTVSHPSSSSGKDNTSPLIHPTSAPIIDIPPTLLSRARDSSDIPSSSEIQSGTLPNLNSPIEDQPSSSKANSSLQQNNQLSPNKFVLLQDQPSEEASSPSASSQLNDSDPPPPQPKVSRSKQSKKAPHHKNKS